MAETTLNRSVLIICLCCAVALAPSLAAADRETTNSSPRGCASDEPPVNPYLANSPWPMSHRNPYNQASSPIAGPTQAEDAALDFLPGEPIAITLAVSGAYPDGRRAIWGTTMQHVFKIDAGGDRMRYAARFPRSQSKQDAISGAYSLVDKDGVYYVPRGPKIESFRDANPGDLDSAIVRGRTFTLPEELRQQANELIVGISMTYDGRIVFLTQRGLVGTLSRLGRP